MPLKRLEAVTVCWKYSDFLAETVKYNAQHFDRWIVVTHPDDADTIELCRKRNLILVTTRELDPDFTGDKIHKGRGIARGMNHTSGDGWILHIDADIVLPNRFRQMLEVAHLNPECIYGVDRVNVHSAEEYDKLIASGYLNDQNGYHLVTLFPQPAKVGARVIKERYGYVPIGFFQLFHGLHGQTSGHRWKDYPDTNSTAAHSDIKFALHWDRRDRHLIPEIIVVHLESEPAPFGVNWKGRRSKPFRSKSTTPPGVLKGGNMNEYVEGN